jgi:hypothetical protein
VAVVLYTAQLWPTCSQTNLNTAMTTNNNRSNKDYGDQTPRLKDFLIVLLALAILIASAWIAYYKFHLFDK